MAIEARTENQRLLLSESDVAMGNAVPAYSTAITQVRPDPTHANKYVLVGLRSSAQPGANVRYGLYGSFTVAGTKHQISSDLGTIGRPANATWQFTRVDLNAYPFPYVFLAVIADGDESAKKWDWMLVE